MSNCEDGSVVGLADDDPVIPVIPTHCKRKSRVNEALCEFDVTTGYWQESDLRK